MTSTILKAIQTLQSGKPIILTDDEHRENEGDLVFPAQAITSEIVNFFIRHCSGIICISLPKKQLDRLQIPLMVPEKDNTSSRKTAFTISIEAAHGISTGVSAHDRAQTLRVASNPNSRPQDLLRPGHIFPLLAHEGGILARAGHTEGALEIVTLAGFHPAAALCELMNEDGSMARFPEVQQFAQKHDLSVLTIAELIENKLASQ